MLIVVKNVLKLIIATIGAAISYIGFNVTEPPFDDVNFRRAVSLAIDRDVMVNAAWAGNAVKAGSHVSPALTYYHKDGITEYETGLELAKKILADAGYTVKNGRLHYPEGVAEKH